MAGVFIITRIHPNTPKMTTLTTLEIVKKIDEYRLRIEVASREYNHSHDPQRIYLNILENELEFYTELLWGRNDTKKAPPLRPQRDNVDK